MPSSEDLSDDYIAQLLAKDAQDRSLKTKYSSYGLQAILPKRPTTNAPKPNTRFLKNIIKETDNHNAALRAKEIADARLRLRRITPNAHPRQHSHSLAHDPFNRNHHEPNGQQRRCEERPRTNEDGHLLKKPRISMDDDDDDVTEPCPSSRSRTHRDHARGDRQQRKPHHQDHNTDSEPERPHHHRHHRHRCTRSRSPKPDRRLPRPRRRRSRQRHRSRSPRRDRHPHRRRSSSTSPPRRPSTHTADHQRSPPSSHRSQSSSSSASDSDPLSSLIGPLPPSTSKRTNSPPIRRGRGTHTLNSSSAIDTHFTSTYDPTLDIQPTALDPLEEDDWDNALEALRDRAKWRQSGADRLRAAGFTDEEVKKWEKGGAAGEGREEDVKWRGRGEGREWDRGKVVGEDGVQVEAEWGRLKGT